MKNSFSKYFLAANSGEGFVSHFADNYDFGDGWRAYIVKGGPGTGKSSFMKYVAVNAIDKGYSVELCPCSSDPDSLDGVIIKNIKTIVLDGTAPHVVEPKFAGICEEIINLGGFWNSKKLFNAAKEIINTTKINKALHKTASAYILSAGELIYDTFALSKGFIDHKKCEKFATSLAVQLIPKKANPTPKEWLRFIGGVTPTGIMAYKNTAEHNYKNMIIIDDKYGAAANIIMQKIRLFALNGGYEIITLKNPFLPSKIIDHIFIPELSLAFVREYDYIKFNDEARRIHSRRFYDINKLREHRNRITFNRRLTKDLLLEAVNTLRKAKLVHDKLEKYYIDAMDFNTLTLFAEQKCKEILSFFD